MVGMVGMKRSVGALGILLAVGAVVACGDDANPDDGDGTAQPDGGASTDGSQGSDGDTLPPDGDASVLDASTASLDAGAPDADAGDAGADADADAGPPPVEDPCAGGDTLPASDDPASPTPVVGYGDTELGTSGIVAMETSIIVPEMPAPDGTLFLWPGLQPFGRNYDVLGNGVLQPVLQYGPSCTPYGTPNYYDTWWITGMYVGEPDPSSPNYAAYNGCHGGPGMAVGVGDVIREKFSLSGTVWTQTITDQKTATTVSFAIDMLDQQQNTALFIIEGWGSKPVGDVIFLDTKVTLESSQPAACAPYERGTNDWFAAPKISKDGTVCCYPKFILRAEGVAATTPNKL